MAERRLSIPVWKTCCSADADRNEEDDEAKATLLNEGPEEEDDDDMNVTCDPLLDEDDPFVRTFRKASTEDVQSERDVLS